MKPTIGDRLDSELAEEPSVGDVIVDHDRIAVVGGLAEPPKTRKQGVTRPIAPTGIGNQLSDRLPGRSRELAQQLTMVKEVRSEQLGEGEDPLGVTDLFENLLLEQGAENRGPLCRTRGAEHLTLS